MPGAAGFSMNGSPESVSNYRRRRKARLSRWLIQRNNAPRKGRSRIATVCETTCPERLILPARLSHAGVLTAAPYNISAGKPVISEITAKPSTVPVNTGFTISVVVTQAGSGIASVQYSIDGGASSPLTYSAAAWSAAAPPLALGVHKVCAIAVDQALNQSDPLCFLVPVYDPSGGFVTGGGWINSPAGAYAPNPSLTGRATFGFNTKYQRRTRTFPREIHNSS